MLELIGLAVVTYYGGLFLLWAICSFVNALNGN